MRIRATVAAVSGALALSAFAVPAAQADDSASRADIAKTWGIASADSGRSAFSSAAAVDGPDVTFSQMKVNGGKPIVAGTTKQVTVPVTYTLTHGADLDVTSDDILNGPVLYLGEIDEPTGFLIGDDAATCTDTSATVASCKGYIDVRPGEDQLLNSDARTWKVGGLALQVYSDDEVGETWQGDLGTTKLQRYSKLTVNASPEPVKKGKTITVTGKLTRANWETNKYAGYTNQSVKLQFKKKGTTTYNDVKTIKSGSGGALKTTVTAATDGYFRYVFAGTSTTPAVKAKGDFVDVQ